jgi:hypothetical protein
MIGLVGLPVFPVNDQKRPLNRNGHKGALPYRRVPKEWPLVGVPTGSASGLSVVDIDVPTGTGWYDANFDGLPLTQVHETRRGGLHLLYKAVPGLGCSTGRVAPGIDVRSDGGFIVWWPRQGLPWEGHPLCEMPEWLVREAMGNSLRREQVSSIAGIDTCVFAGIDTCVSVSAKGADGALEIGRRLFALTRQQRRMLRALGIEPTRNYRGRLASLRWQLDMVPNHKRNDILFWVGCRFAELIVDGRLRPEHAIWFLMNGARTNGLREEDGDRQCMITIASAFGTVERMLAGAWRRSNGGPSMDEAQCIMMAQDLPAPFSGNSGDG